MPQFLFTIPLALSVCCFATAATADDWVAQKLRGEVYLMVQGSWVSLKRGDIVSDSSAVRTMKDGQVEFARDHETITLGHDTQIRIFDRTGQRYTTVKEAIGSVRVEANVENIKHFSVQTPFLAATVKGTIFTVVSGNGTAKVRVQRGKVRVDDVRHGLHVDVRVGQTATTGKDKTLHIAGGGKLAAVVNAAGKPVSDPKDADTEKQKNKDKKDNENRDDQHNDGDQHNDKGHGNGNDNGPANGDGNDKGNGDGKNGGNDKGNGDGNGKGNGNDKGNKKD